MVWDLKLRDEDTRTAIQDRHGGSESRGISARAIEQGPGDIMLWWRPDRGELYGYVDGWTESGDAFYFSGTGQEGDQHFAAPCTENRRLRDHAATNDRVRLLRYVAKNGVRYVAELRLDPDDPWRWRDGYDRLGQKRRVIQFRLLPVGPAERLSADPVRPSEPNKPTPEAIATVPAEPSATDVEALRKDHFQRLLRVHEQVATRVEARLVHEFRDWLDDVHGLSATGLRIPYSVERASLRADLFLTSPRVLVEAKASAAREHLRLGIGQLLDYRRWIQPPPRLCLLVPTEPPEDMLGLMRSLGIGSAWRTKPTALTFAYEPADLLAPG